MMRDLKQRFVDGLILGSLRLTPAHADRARASGRAGHRHRDAAEGHARRHGAGEVAQGRRRGRSPPVRGRPAADRLRQRARSRRCRGRRGGSATSTGCAPAGSRVTRTLIEVADDFMVDPGRRAVERLLERARPDAILCANDLLAVGALAALRDAGLDVPRTMALVGMDNSALSEPHLADADDDRPRLGRARAHRGRAAVRAHRGPRRRAARRSASSRASSFEPHPGRRVTRPRRRGAALPRQARGRAGAALGPRDVLLLIPAMLPIVILSVLPLARGIYLGFTDARAGLDVRTNFIGLDNFRRLLDDELFINSFKIGIIWAVVGDGDPVRARARARAAAQPAAARPLARALARARAVGDAVGDRRDHVEAHLPAAGGRAERGAAPRRTCPAQTSTGSPTSRGRCRP